MNFIRRFFFIVSSQPTSTTILVSNLNFRGAKRRKSLAFYTGTSCLSAWTLFIKRTPSLIPKLGSYIFTFITNLYSVDTSIKWMQTLNMTFILLISIVKNLY